MTKKTHFDYIIVGNGLSGLQLALGMAGDAFFKNKDIALIDSSKKETNDKTWSFWEAGISPWEPLTYHSWDTAKVATSNSSITLNLSPYRYKTVRAIDFYNHAKNTLSQHPNFHFLLEHVTKINEEPDLNVSTKNNCYQATHVFDSRVPASFFTPSKKHTAIIQHFKGYVIKTTDSIFDPEEFTMMDFRLKDGSQTTFTYVLPFSKTEALVEFTYFTEQVVQDQVYDTYLQAYIKDFLNIEDYDILEIEIGQIPMTDFPFKRFNTPQVTKIGTGGGWVKASSGYSFKHSEKKVTKIIKNLKSNRKPSRHLFKGRYAFYDAIFLNVLKNENHKGEWVFDQFYRKNTPELLFKFLDEETTFIEELMIFRSLFSVSFIKAFFKTCLK